MTTEPDEIKVVYFTEAEREAALTLHQADGYELRHDDRARNGERILTFRRPAPRGEPTPDEIEFTRVQALIAALDGRNLTLAEVNEVLRYTLKRVVS
jgi:hypothetical protein